MSTTKMIKVWDIPTRIFHWLLLALFIFSYITSEEDTPWHIYSGYTIITLISLRVLWGFVGSYYARFNQFVYSPATVLAYTKNFLAKKPARYLGHNPLGGWMVVTMLLLLFGITLSGLKLYGVKEHAGPFATKALSTESSAALLPNPSTETPALESGAVGMPVTKTKRVVSPEEKFWKNIHETGVNLMLVLISLHILGVIVSGKLHRENLVKAMFTGQKAE